MNASFPNDCAREGVGIGCEPPAPPGDVVAVCVVGNAAPFVSRKPSKVNSTLETYIREEVLPLEDFMHQYQGHDVDMIVALIS
jgi:hypothetical protein